MTYTVQSGTDPAVYGQLAAFDRMRAQQQHEVNLQNVRTKMYDQQQILNAFDKIGSGVQGIAARRRQDALRAEDREWQLEDIKNRQDWQMEFADFQRFGETRQELQGRYQQAVESGQFSGSFSDYKPHREQELLDGRFDAEISRRLREIEKLAPAEREAAFDAFKQRQDYQFGLEQQAQVIQQKHMADQQALTQASSIVREPQKFQIDPVGVQDLQNQVNAYNKDSDFIAGADRNAIGEQGWMDLLQARDKKMRRIQETLQRIQPAKPPQFMDKIMSGEFQGWNENGEPWNPKNPRGSLYSFSGVDDRGMPFVEEIPRPKVAEQEPDMRQVFESHPHYDPATNEVRLPSGWKQIMGVDGKPKWVEPEKDPAIKARSDFEKRENDARKDAFREAMKPEEIIIRKGDPEYIAEFSQLEGGKWDSNEGTPGKRMRNPEQVKKYVQDYMDVWNELNQPPAETKEPDAATSQEPEVEYFGELQPPRGAAMISVEMNGKHYVISSEANGQLLKPQQAIDAFKANPDSALAVFKTPQEADRYRIQRGQELMQAQDQQQQQAAVQQRKAEADASMQRRITANPITKLANDKAEAAIAAYRKNPSEENLRQARKAAEELQRAIQQQDQQGNLPDPQKEAA